MNKLDITKINHKRYSENASLDDNHRIKYLKFLVTRILISLILVIGIAIFVKVNDLNKSYVQKYLFEDNLKFTEINQLYQKYFGKIIPNPIDKDEMVFSGDDLKKQAYEKYENGVKFNISTHSPVSTLIGGIVVFIGEKDIYGNTVIVQGNDGVDYWYGGLTNLSINLYDYIETNALLGETSADFLYLVLKKDNNYLNYEEYIK